MEKEQQQKLNEYAKLCAHNIIETAHFTYNAPRGITIVKVCIEILEKEIEKTKSHKKRTPSRTSGLGISLAKGIITNPGLCSKEKKFVVEVCIWTLKERIREIQPKQAEPDYKEARYGSKKPR